VHLLDEVFEHLLGDGEVGDHAILHRADRLQVARGAAQHQLGFRTHRLHRALAPRRRIGTDRHHRGLVQHDATVTHINQRIGGTEVDREIGGKILGEKLEHGGSDTRESGRNGRKNKGSMIP